VLARIHTVHSVYVFLSAPRLTDVEPSLNSQEDSQIDSLGNGVNAIATFPLTVVRSLSGG
jgi:hypothetical protein